MAEYPQSQAPTQNGKAPAMSVADLAAAQAAKLVTGLWDEHQSATTVRRGKILDWYKQYRGIPNRKNYQGRANVFVPETLQAVESIVSQEIHTIFAEPRYLMLLPREPTDEPKARLTEGAMFYYLDKINWKSKMIRSDRQKVKYGTCYVEVLWESREGLVPKRQKDSPLPKMLKARVKDQPQVNYIDEVDIALDPGIPEVEDMSWVIIRKRYTWDDMQAQVKKGVYSGKQVDKVKKGAGKGADFQSGKHQRFQSAGIQMANIDRNDYEVLKMWGFVPKWWVDDIDVNAEDADEMVPGVVEVCHGSGGTTLRLQRNPFWHQEIPVALGRHIGVDDEAQGMGICEVAEKLQEELNDKRNQLLDHATDNIMPPIVENRAADIKEIRWEPGFRIKSNLPADQALKALYPGGNPGEVVMMEQRVKDDIKGGSGATAPVQGLQSGKESTAFEVSQLSARGSGRIDLSTIDFGESFLKRVYRLIYKNIQQFTDQETMIRILGKDGIKWEKLTPEDVDADMDVIPRIPTDVDNRIIVRNQMIQFLAQVAPFFPRINAYKLVRRIYELFGFDDVEEVVPRPSSEFDRMQLTTEEEMQVLFMGQRINVEVGDNHAQKLAALVQFMAQYEAQMKPEAIEAFKDKIRQHMQYLQAIESMKASMPQGGGPGAPAPEGGGMPGGQPTQGAPGHTQNMTHTLRTATPAPGGRQ